MKGDLKWKIPVIVVIVLLCAWFLQPTTDFKVTTQTIENLQQTDIPEEVLTKLSTLEGKDFSSKNDFVSALENQEIEQTHIATLAEQASVQRGPINLGLDLQGGVHLVLEVEAEEYVKAEMLRLEGLLGTELKKKGLLFDSMSVQDDNTLKITAATPEQLKKISEYIAEQVTSLEKKGTLPSDGTVLTLKFKDDIADRWRANAIDQALLTIRNRVDEYGLTEPVIQRQGRNRIIVELAGEKDPQRAVKLLQVTAQLRFQLVKGFAATKEELLAQHNNQIPEEYEILPGAVKEDGSGGGFYLVEKEAKVTGANLKDARVSKDEMGLPAVSFELDRDGAKSFAVISEQNIGKALAIVLDGTVQTAPTFRTRIPTGQGQITGLDDYEEAEDTSIVLRAGALPAPVNILENISVGPTLGEDSIRAGRQAILIGAVIVMIFMLIYYKASGLIADVALLFNFLFIMGGLASFKLFGGSGATLTLPGLAGIALTVGMAVDANVLIFERIKEELRIGKTLRSAVENGFSRAYLTIMDANLTTLIAAVVLFQFGTGPVKGFAVTLSIGILSTLFTALFLSKVLFDLILQSGKVKQLSI